MFSRKCIIITIIIVFVVVVVMFQNRQVTVTFLGCCWYSVSAPQSSDVGVPATSWKRWVRGGRGEMESDSDIIIKDVCEQGM